MTVWRMSVGGSRNISIWRYAEQELWQKLIDETMRRKNGSEFYENYSNLDARVSVNQALCELQKNLASKRKLPRDVKWHCHQTIAHERWQWQFDIATSSVVVLWLCACKRSSAVYWVNQWNYKNSVYSNLFVALSLGAQHTQLLQLQGVCWLPPHIRSATELVWPSPCPATMMTS